MQQKNISTVNNRQGRAGSGILFLLLVIAWFPALLLGKFCLLKIFSVLLVIDFGLRIILGPKYSPSLFLGGLLVAKQEPELTPFASKRFAWILGFIFSLLIFTLLIILGQTSIFVLILVAILGALFFLESSCSICVGCKLYSLWFGKRAESCPDGNCE